MNRSADSEETPGDDYDDTVHLPNEPEQPTESEPLTEEIPQIEDEPEESESDAKKEG